MSQVRVIGDSDRKIPELRYELLALDDSIDGTMLLFLAHI